MTTFPTPGVGYAWLPRHHDLVEPVLAVPFDGAAPEPLWDTITEFYGDPVEDMYAVDVTLHHPDDGEIPSRVALQDLRGPWSAPPSTVFIEATGWEPGRTWAQVARDRYVWVCEQRTLAEALERLGIHRARRHYAGRGGTSRDQRQLDTGLALTHEEMALLLRLAERGNS